MPTCPDTPGELRYIEALGGGALMDLGCYCMHWIRTVAGDEPTVVSATARCATPGVDLDIEAELAFTSGPTATLKCSMQPDDGALSRHLRVHGDAGMLELDNPVSPHSGATLSIESANAHDAADRLRRRNHVPLPAAARHRCHRRPRRSR